MRFLGLGGLRTQYFTLLRRGAACLVRKCVVVYQCQYYLSDSQPESVRSGVDFRVLVPNLAVVHRETPEVPISVR